MKLALLSFLKEQFLKENKIVQENFLCVFNALSGKYFVQEFDKEGNAKFEAKWLKILILLKIMQLLLVWKKKI